MAPADAPTPPRYAPVVAAAVILFALLAYRGYGPRFAARPTDHHFAAASTVELNSADRTELVQIPGVGPALADAILLHRGTRGPFADVSQLNDVKGIGPRTLDTLRRWVRVDAPAGEPAARGQAPAEDVVTLARKPPVLPPPAPPPAGGKKLAPGQTVDVNTAAAEELQLLPAIGAVIAARIVAERGNKPFAAVEDLRRVSGIGAKTLDKLRPFVRFK